MRKDNSEWITSFVSEAGKHLQNHDDFAFVELDDLACWVLVDGIDHSERSESAKLVLETIIQEFTDNPSMSKGKLTGYVTAAHDVLQVKSIPYRFKASVLVVVTDYIKIRWVSSGNTRLQVVRNNSLFAKSTDQSYMQHMIDEGMAPSDESYFFEERNNLYNYLGTPDKFQPIVSKKIKLQDNDCLVVSTVGFWEHINHVEVIDAIESSTEAEEAVNTLEDFLLSKQPQELNNYTIISIFVNKVYLKTNNTWKMIRRILFIAIPILIMLSIFLFFWYMSYRDKQEHIENREQYEQNGDEYIEEENYERALAVYDSGLKESKAADKTDKVLEAKQKVTQLIVDGDTFLEDGKYEQALSSYEKAKEDIKNSPDLKELFDIDSLNQKIAIAQGYIDINEYIALGDKQMEVGDYSSARDSYNQANAIALNYGLLDVQQDIGMKIATLDTKVQQQSNDMQKAEADALVANGDAALEAGKHDEAVSYYNQALSLYTNLGLSDKVTATNQKVTDANAEKQARASEEFKKEAEALEKEGDSELATGNYDAAKACYREAQSIYQSANLPDKVLAMEDKLKEVDTAEQKEAEQKATEEKASQEG